VSQSVTVRDLLHNGQRTAHGERADTATHEDRRVRWRDILNGEEVTAVTEPSCASIR
jgi:hypothetical protein